VILLNAAAQVQAVLLVIAAVVAGLAALLGVLRQLLGEGWWRRLRRKATATAPDNDEVQA
jgi:hypothetical protein